MPTDLPIILTTLRDLHARLPDVQLEIAEHEPTETAMRFKRKFWQLGDSEGKGLGFIFGNDETLAAFIAASHNHLPAVLDEVERLRADYESANCAFQAVSRDLSAAKMANESLGTLIVAAHHEAARLRAELAKGGAQC